MNLALAPDGEAPAPRPELQDPRAEPKEDPEVANDMTISLRGYKDVRSRGLVSALTLTTNTGNEELPGSSDDREQLLAERLAANEARPRTVRLAAESDVHWSQVVRIMDVCGKAGYQIRFSKPPDLGAGQ